MKLRLPKSALALFVSTSFGIAAAVSIMPDVADLTLSGQDSDNTAQPELTNLNSSGLTNVSMVISTATQTTDLVPLNKFVTIAANRQPVEIDLAAIDKSWDLAYAPILLESIRFMPERSQDEVISFLSRKTKQQFGFDLDKWRHWIWKQKFKPHPDLAKFKSKLYSKIDPRFAEYFAKADGATIRLDEIRWGGVLRDGIPPLNKPKMITAAQATYLGDADVVFGVDINGDARCYPKRILAWHEMFKDTVGGESICGVY